MIDYYIFGFGLVVTLLVGSGLTMMIIAHNRAVELEEREAASPSEVAPAQVVSSASKPAGKPN